MLAEVRDLISNTSGSAKPDGTRSGRNRLVMEEEQPSESYMALATTLRGMMETSQRAPALKAMARYRMRGDNPPGKPGFRPIAQ